MFDRSPIGMFRSDQIGNFMYANGALAGMLGYSIPELLELDLDDIYVDLALRQQLLAKYFAQRYVDGMEIDWRRKDGGVISVQVWGHIVEHDHGWSFDASVLDVSDVKRQREELERTKRILELVVNQMPAMYWVTTTDLMIVRVGGAVEPILGHPQGAFVAASLETLHRTDPGTTDPVPYHLRALNGEICSYDTLYHGRQLAVTVAPYRAADGTLLGAIGTLNDVTHSRTLERRLVDAQRAESLGVLAGGLAHDFNNLLVAVLGNADLALRELPRGMPGRAAVENVRDAGIRAAELTHQLLTFSGKGGAGTTRMSPATVVEELLRILGPSLPPAISITAAIPADLQLRADPGQLRQVLLNLITNARDAVLGRPGGSINLRGSLYEHDGLPSSSDVILADPGSYVLLEVIDDGAGMSDETRSHVFEPFFTTKEHGHGIGLAAVLGIVRAHRGGLRLSTRPGTGATFQVLWPAAVSVPGRAPTPPSTPATRVVLVIDDEDLVRDVVARMIEDLGYGTLTAADGATGIALAAANPIDAVLVDLSMPRMNGREVIARLRKDRPKLPIIVCSGYDRDGHGPTQADAYLPKPFRIDVLERTLAKLLVH